jgi:hypothetical protein
MVSLSDLNSLKVYGTYLHIVFAFIYFHHIPQLACRFWVLLTWPFSKTFLTCLRNVHLGLPFKILPPASEIRFNMIKSIYSSQFMLLHLPRHYIFLLLHYHHNYRLLIPLSGAVTTCFLLPFSSITHLHAHSYYSHVILHTVHPSFLRATSFSYVISSLIDYTNYYYLRHPPNRTGPALRVMARPLYV